MTKQMTAKEALELEIEECEPWLHRRYDTALNKYRIRHPRNLMEKILLSVWQNNNTIRSGSAPAINLILSDAPNMPNWDLSERDIEVAATIIQWLGTNCGQGFLWEVGVLFKKEIELQKRQRSRIIEVMNIIRKNRHKRESEND